MYILGVDLGTTSMTSLLYNDKGKMIKKVTKNYDLITRSGGISEQDPKEWLLAFDEIILDLQDSIDKFNDKLSSISISGQMHSLVLLDKKNQVLRNAILWNDTRTTEQVNNLNKNKDLLLKETKNIAQEGFTLPKLLWVRENENEIYNDIETFMLPKDYLSFIITGNKYMEESDAAGTLMFNVTNKKWSKAILDEYQLDISIFPKVLKPGEFAGFMKTELLDKYNFTNEIKLFIGAADNVASAIGVGLSTPGKSMLSLGTSGVYLTLADKKLPTEGDIHFFNYANDLFYNMGVTLTAGKSLSWIKSIIDPNISFDEFTKGLNNSKPGSNGLIFTPYLQGERTPHIDGQIRGSFIGLSINHKKDDIIRSVVEGITFSLKDSQVLIEKYYPKSKDKPLIVVGGGAKNKAWLQIIADIMNKEVHSVKIEEGAALGSVLLAYVSLGIYKTLEEAYEQTNGLKETYVPNVKNTIKYQKIFEIYQRVYKQTKDISRELQNI